MKKLDGTKTQANLMAAFAGESQAHTKYQYYASKAKKDGYVQIANLFTETSNNEKEHAKICFMTGLFPILLQILKMPQQAKTMSGQICTQHSPKRQGKRDLMRSLSFLKRLQRLKKSMSKDISNCLKMLRAALYSAVMKIRYGNAATAAI